METKINEIADGVFRLSTYVPEVTPDGFTFNQYLIDAEEPMIVSGQALYRVGCDNVAEQNGQPERGEHLRREHDSGRRLAGRVRAARGRCLAASVAGPDVFPLVGSEEPAALVVRRHAKGPGLPGVSVPTAHVELVANRALLVPAGPKMSYPARSVSS